MELAGIIIGALILVGLVFVVWITRPVRSAFDDPVPYKLEPIETSEPGKYPPLENAHETTADTSEDVAVPERNFKSLLENWPIHSEQLPKRKYTKRSKFWTSDKPAKRMQKARKAKRKSK
jgi:FtsZ-interacting cell division protein ZipA